MPSLREIRRKIKSVKSTQQITKAMKMVAAARMRRAQASILSSRPFAARMEEAVRDLALLEVAADIEAGREVQIHPFFDARETGEACLIAVSGDKGLCGAFNSNVIRASLEWLRRQAPGGGGGAAPGPREGSAVRIPVAVVGRKARDVFHRLKGFPIEFLAEVAGIFPKVTYAHAELVGKSVIEAYLEGRLRSVDVIYNEFKSVASQRVVTARLLPIPVPEPGEAEGSRAPGASPGGARGPGPDRLLGFKFEPGRERLLEAMLPRFVKAQLYRILLESQAAELAARMNAMDAASKNAGELIGAMTLRLNRTRQGIITREIAELVGGAEALSS